MLSEIREWAFGVYVMRRDGSVRWTGGMMVPMCYGDDVKAPVAHLLVMLGHLLTWRDLAAAYPDEPQDPEHTRLEEEVHALLYPAAWGLLVDGWTRSVHRSSAAAFKAREALVTSKRYRWGAHQPPVEVRALTTQAETFAARREARKIRGTRYGGPR